MMNFAIVKFFATNNARATIAIVPVGWLSREEDEVWWPPVNSSKASGRPNVTCPLDEIGKK